MVQPPPAPNDPAAASAAAKPVLLVVDDQPANVYALFEILRSDYEICVATSGEAALAFCDARLPDLILLDIGMPGMDGHEVCRRIRSQQSTADIPIVFVTARNSPEEEARALNEGAVDFIPVPFHETVVRARVRTQLTHKMQAELLRSSAATDGLTGLANRRRFDEALDEEWRRAFRDREPISLLLLDVDRFKSFNDRYGHLAGDVCLREISAELKRFARRPGDIVARYGGEEIAILLPRAEGVFAKKRAEAVRESIAALAIPHESNSGCGGIVTVSIGIATFKPREQQGDPMPLIARADQLLYEAKRMGRNRTMAPDELPVDPIAPPPPDEAERITSVAAIERALAGERSAHLDDIAQLAAALLGTPIGLVSLVGRDEQMFVGRFGIDAQRTSRDVSFCAHALSGDGPLVVANATLDERFRNNPLVTGELGIRFYAGAPLKSLSGGPNMGALCVIDRAARAPLTSEQNAELAMLAKLAMLYIERSLGPSGDAPGSETPTG